jgi:hypothetical protein
MEADSGCSGGDVRRHISSSLRTGALSGQLRAPLAATASLTPVALAHQRHVLTGHASASHALELQASDGGRLTDGMGTGGHNASYNGQDYAVVQAAAGQMAQVDVRALWLSQGNNVHVKVDGGEETILQGTELPPPEGGGRRFRSRAGGKIQVMLVTDVPASLSFVSLSIRSQCADASGCDLHGVCSGGNCTCSSGYSGMGAWPTVLSLQHLLWQLAAPILIVPSAGCRVPVWYD